MPVQIIGLGVVDVRLLLRDQHDALVGLHGHVECVDRFLATHEQRDDHVRVHHYIAQWQNREALDGYGLGSRWRVGHLRTPTKPRRHKMQRRQLYLVKV
jgi:hypothetical protein